MAARKLGSLAAVATRSQEAVSALDAAMTKNWVILFRAPALMPSSFIAFQPLRVPGDAIRVHPLTTPWMNVDFDGDQAALFLPITEAGQQEALECLSLACHFARDPDVVRPGWLSHDAMWGLAHLARTADGRRQIDEAAGQHVWSDTVILSPWAHPRRAGRWYRCRGGSRPIAEPRFQRSATGGRLHGCFSRRWSEPAAKAGGG